MYESYFGFVNRPFLASPSLDRYYPSTAIEQTIQTATRVIARAEGPVAIFGGTGLGKSITCLRIAEHFQRAFEVVTLTSSPLVTRRALLQSLLFELKMPYRDMSEGELRLTLMNRIQPSADSKSDGILLIVDEAQTLPLKLLDEIRLLTNVHRNGLPRVRLVLCGNLKLEETLCHPQMDSLNQRLGARCYLTPLSREETANYVVHKIEISGVNHARVITREALDALHRGSDGIPRLVDQLADQAMLIASQERVCPVTADIVGKAWGMLQQLPNPWSEPESIASKPLTVAQIQTGNSSQNKSQSRSIQDDSMADVRSVERNSASSNYPVEASQSRPTITAVAQSTAAPVISSHRESIIEFGDLEDTFESTHGAMASISHSNDTVNPNVAVDTPSVSMFSSHTLGAWDESNDSVETQPESPTAPSVNTPAGLDSVALDESRTPLKLKSSGSVKSAYGKKKPDTKDPFGSDFDEEFNLPVQYGVQSGTQSGAAFGNLNYDVDAFDAVREANESLNRSTLTGEADSFLELSATPAVDRRSFTVDSFGGASQHQEIEPQFDEYEVEDENVYAESDEGTDEYGYDEQMETSPFLGRRWDNSFEAGFDSEHSGGYDSEYAHDDSQLERQVEDEMRELVSELNLSAMSFDPTQIIVELEPSDEADEDYDAEFNADSKDDLFEEIQSDWNHGQAYAESSRRVASDDRDMLVVEEDLEEIKSTVQFPEPTESARPVLHPYAKLFSNLRKN